jgi:hypothetical protein
MKTNLKVLFSYLLLSYGLFYYAYKFGSPDLQGLKDYEEYEKMYETWDIEHIESPFNTRLVSAYVIYSVNKLHLSYDTDIAYTNELQKKQTYFTALLVNYIFILINAWLIFVYIKKYGLNEVWSFAGGLMFLYSSSTLFFYLNPLTEAFSALLATLIFISIQRKNFYFIIPLLIAILQREYLFFMFGLFAVLMFWYEKADRGYYLKLLSATLVAFVIYFILRKTIFYTPQHADQLSFSAYSSNITRLYVSIGTYLKQALIIQNTLVIYYAVIVYKWFTKQRINAQGLVFISAFIVQMIIIAQFASLGQTIGRLLFFCSPLLIYHLLLEVKQSKLLSLKNENLAQSPR